MKGSGLQYFGGSIASISFLLYGDVLLHLINVTVKESGQIERNRVKGDTLKPVETSMRDTRSYFHLHVPH